MVQNRYIICDYIDSGGDIEKSEHELTMKHGEQMKNYNIDSSMQET